MFHSAKYEARNNNNALQVRLEEKQRTARRQRESEALIAAENGEDYPAYEATWFRKEADPHNQVRAFIVLFIDETKLVIDKFFFYY